MDHDCLPCCHGLFRNGEKETCQFRALLVYSSPLYHLLHLLAASWYVLHDQARSSAVLFLEHHWCLLGAPPSLHCRLGMEFDGFLQRYWLVGGVIWIWERVLREVRSRHRTYISKVIQHPSNVMEIQIKKEKTTTQAGQYIFICCPEISYFQWHPFTLTRCFSSLFSQNPLTYPFLYISVHQRRITFRCTSALSAISHVNLLKH